MAKSYEKAGVSLEAGYESVKRIKKHIFSTKRKGIFGAFGAFGGMFDLSALNMKEPVLVSGTDGVGTKLLLAIEQDKHDTIGIDLVAMCVNDCLAQGAEPLFFLDYIAVNKNIPAQIEQIVKGIADGCKQANCALIGGETAEMSDMYPVGHYDLAGFSVAACEKSDLIDGSKVRSKDVIIGLMSSGIHSNGYSLVRKIINDNSISFDELLDGKRIGDVLLEPTKIYVKSVLKLAKKIDLHSVIHITGGGFHENIPRGLKPGLGAKIDVNWNIPNIFNFLQEKGNIPREEMYSIFNMGIGMMVIVSKDDAQAALKILTDAKEEAIIIGEVTEIPGVEICE